MNSVEQERGPRAQVIAALTAVLLVQCFAAARRDLFADEAFYAACATRPALAYADHPFLTAALVRGGVELFGWSSFGVRSMFLLLGLCLPALLAGLSRELGGSAREACWAAAAGVVLPGLALLPSLAVPDLPLIVLGTAGLLAGLRALRTNRWVDWLFTGAAFGLVLCTHLRGVLLLAGFVIGLALTARGRRAFRSVRAGCALVLTAAGALPMLLDALLNASGSLSYQLSERHATSADWGALLEFPLVQAALVCTPLLAFGLAAAAWQLWRARARGNAAAGLALGFALVPVLAYFAASPFSDRARAHQHWALGAYVPLLAVFPSVAARWWAAGGSRRALACAAPALGALLVLFVIVDLFTGWPGTQVLHRKFAGWSATATHTLRVIDELPAAERPQLLVADHYMLAAQLEFALRAAGRADLPVYVLSHPRNREHGRQPQYRRWELDEQALRTRGGARALLVMELDATRSREREAWRAHAASRVGEQRPLGDARYGWADNPLELSWSLGRVNGSPPAATTSRAD
ncbi:MAG: hypothetical protein DHS20C15_04960 [Planctomycetota bacterium]|nr:MAG: hypothetical protein DHS20C15_04960 [Planctomycetota bacterium]